MDWISLISSVVSCGFVLTTIEAIKYRRQNSRIKDAEARKNEADAIDKENDNKIDAIEIQQKQMNLADDYMERVLKLTEVNGGKMDEVISKINSMENEVKNIVSYLNGGYKEYVTKHKKS
jgi:hypothetical protein